jgi:predicted aspartyl protease
MTIAKELAASLLRRGIAARSDIMDITLADGSVQSKVTFTIGRISIGSHLVENVRAVINLNNADMLLPFGILNQAGRFTIDSAKGILTFGQEAMTKEESVPPRSASPKR